MTTKIEICQDVIRRIQDASIRIATGNIINLAGTNETYENILPQDIDRLYAEPECEVCANGALLLSFFYKNGGEWEDLNQFLLEYNDIHAESKILRNLLESYFPEDELDQIEAAFEYMYLDYLPLPKYRYEKAINFGKKFEDDADRCLAIMQNIVDNGEFCPEIEYEICED